MSAKNSWDVPRRAAAVKKEEKTARPLKARRKEKRHRASIILGVLFVLLMGVALYVVWLPALRISTVSAAGPHADTIPRVAEEALWGTYGYVLPRNSIFFPPTSAMRTIIIEAYPDISAVSLSAVSFNELRVESVARASAFVWCGESVDTPAPSCYDADAEGLVFAEHSAGVASTTALKVYSALQGSATTTPVRAHVVSSELVPSILRFVRAVKTLGVPVQAIAIRGDEADIHVPGNTRITYVLGREEQAASLAASAFPTLKLPDSTIEYIDLRFEKKVYVKRR